MLTEVIERTAPSPTGYLHLGHVFSALTAYKRSIQLKGQFKLRLEDIDYTRCKSHYENQIIKDLRWLGIKWNGQVMKQRNRRKFYAAGLDELKQAGLIYPCSCTRNDIKHAVSAPHKDDTSLIVYPGTCLKNPPTKGITALRLNIKKALQVVDRKELYFYDLGFPKGQRSEKQIIHHDHLLNKFGDLIIARKDIGTSYNLSVVIDDASQNISHITRGFDLLDVTPIQVLLQKLLSIKTPFYYHHALLCDQSGKKLSKRTNSDSVLGLKERGISATEVIEMALNHRHKKLEF